MTVAGTADRGFGLGHIPVATTGKRSAECVCSVSSLQQTVRQSTAASKCVKRPVSTLLLCRFFLPAERDQDSFVSYLAPRSSSSQAQGAPRSLASSRSL